MFSALEREPDGPAGYPCELFLLSSSFPKSTGGVASAARNALNHSVHPGVPG